MEKNKRNYNLIELSKKHPNKWVALSRDHKKVLAIGDRLKEVSLKNKEEAVFLKLFPKDSFYMPQVL
ncbi:MAG: DUF5678 domain-containing protein [Patescibacteria group bacterium]